MFDRKVDNLVILMSLTITKLLIHRWKGNQRIARLVERRIDRLMNVYRNPEA